MGKTGVPREDIKMGTTEGGPKSLGIVSDNKVNDGKLTTPNIYRNSASSSPGK